MEVSQRDANELMIEIYGTAAHLNHSIATHHSLPSVSIAQSPPTHCYIQYNQSPITTVITTTHHFNQSIATINHNHPFQSLNCKYQSSISITQLQVSIILFNHSIASINHPFQSLNCKHQSSISITQFQASIIHFNHSISSINHPFQSLNCKHQSSILITQFQASIIHFNHSIASINHPFQSLNHPFQSLNFKHQSSISITQFQASIIHFNRSIASTNHPFQSLNCKPRDTHSDPIISGFKEL